MFCKIRIIDNEPFRKAINDVFLFLFIMGIIYGESFINKSLFSGEFVFRWGWRRRARGHPTFRGDNPLKKYLALQFIIEKGLNALRLDDSLFRGKGRPNIFSSRRTLTLHLWMPSAPAAGLDSLWWVLKNKNLREALHLCSGDWRGQFFCWKYFSRAIPQAWR